LEPIIDLYLYYYYFSGLRIATFTLIDYMGRMWVKVAVASMIVCQACHPYRELHNDDEAAIRRLVAEYNASWEQHDTTMRHKLFAEDADITNVVGKTVHGRASMVEIANTPIYQRMYSNAVLQIDSVSIRFLTYTIAAVDGRWSMTGALHPDGTPWTDRRGLINLIVTREKGVWLIKIFHNAEFPDRPK